MMMMGVMGLGDGDDGVGAMMEVMGLGDRVMGLGDGNDGGAGAGDDRAWAGAMRLGWGRDGAGTAAGLRRRWWGWICCRAGIAVGSGAA